MKSRKSPAKPSSTTPLSTANQQPQEVVKQNQQNAAPTTKKNHGRQAKHEEIKIRHNTTTTATSQKQITETGINELREYAFKDEPCEIGIDEAGRGPVLGPMVYGCTFWPISQRDEFKKQYKFTDSKQLNEQQREEMFEQIKSCEFSRLGYFTAVLHADYLSNLMLAEMKSGGKNLNTISHDTAIDLIKKVKALGVNVKRVVLDTVGQPHSYKQLLHNRLKDDELEIIVESKADLNHPVVSAASICAKVTRDQVLADWQFPEDKKIDTDYGCGYPGDPKAKEWLKRNLDPVFGFPTLVRFSWKTCSTILEDNQVNINWRDDIDEKDKKQQKLNYGAKKEDVVGLPKYKTKTQKERYNNKALRQTGVRREFEL